MGEIGGTKRHEEIRSESLCDPEYTEIKLKKGEGFSCHTRPVLPDIDVLKTEPFQEVKRHLLVPGDDQNFMALIREVPYRPFKEVNMGRVSDVDQYSHASAPRR